MKSSVILPLLAILTFYYPKAYGQNSFFDARVNEYGQLEQVLGDKWNEIDSLIVYGPINEADFKTIVRSAKDGHLKIVNLQHALVENNKIPNFAFVDKAWYDSGRYLDIRRIILPDNITEFGACAFLKLALRHINMPSSLKKMGEGCFEDNKWLEVNPLIIPEGVTEIPIRCFPWCENLKKIVLPSTLKTIDILAFYCTSIQEMNFPEGLDSIGHSAIYVTNLTEIVLPNTVKKLGNAAFQGNKKLKKLVLPKGITEIPIRFCYQSPMLEDLEIPKSVIKIHNTAFSSCTKLNIQLPPAVKWIDYEAFDNCALDSIVFPASVEFIGGAAFSGLQSLQKIYSLSPTPPICGQHPMMDKGCGPFHGFTPSDIPVYVPVGSGEKYRQAFGWNYFSNIIETDKLPTGIVSPQTGNAGQYNVYGKDGKLVIDILNTLPYPLRYSIYSISGELIEQGLLTESLHLQMKSDGVYLVRIGATTHKVFL